MRNKTKHTPLKIRLTDTEIDVEDLETKRTQPHRAAESKWAALYLGQDETMLPATGVE